MKNKIASLMARVQLAKENGVDKFQIVTPDSRVYKTTDFKFCPEYIEFVHESGITCLLPEDSISLIGFVDVEPKPNPKEKVSPSSIIQKNTVERLRDCAERAGFIVPPFYPMDRNYHGIRKSWAEHVLSNLEKLLGVRTNQYNAIGARLRVVEEIIELQSDKSQ